MDIFISYSRLYRSKVREFAHLLVQSGHTPWFDDSLLPGQEWESVLKNQIGHCDVFIAIVSADYLKSPWCAWELNLANESKKPMLPVQIAFDSNITSNESIPEIFKALQIAHFDSKSQKQDINKILGGLSHLNTKIDKNLLPEISEHPLGKPSRERWHSEYRKLTSQQHVHEDLDKAIRRPIDFNHQTNQNTNSELIFGVDFGTTTSYCAVFWEGDVKIIPNSTGYGHTVSAIYINEDGSIEAGQIATQRLLTDPANGLLQVKRMAGSGKVLRSRGETYTPAQLIAAILKETISGCQEFLGHSCKKAVITVPAYFSELEKDDIRLACKIADFELKRLIVEPTAVCHNLNSTAPETFAVFDLGGGTFDISILETVFMENDYLYEVYSTVGLPNLGGADYDETIVEYCLIQFKAQTGINLEKNFTARMRLREAAETAKIELTTRDTALINIPYFYANASGAYDLIVNLTRLQFEQLTDHLTTEIMLCCEKAVKEAKDNIGFLSSKIDKLIMVGQASQTPGIKQLVESKFACSAVKGIDPKRSVATGAAIHSAILMGECKNKLLLDICTFGYGIYLSSDTPIFIIDKYATIPTKKSIIVQLKKPSRANILLSLIEGSEDSKQSVKEISRFNVEIDTRRFIKGNSIIKVTVDVEADREISVNIECKDVGLNKSWSNLSSAPVFEWHDDDLKKHPTNLTLLKDK